MEPVCGAVQERQPFQRRYGVCCRVKERRGRRGFARVFPRKQGEEIRK